MNISIELDEDDLKQVIYQTIANAYAKDWSSLRRDCDRIVADQVRKIIYEDKDRIIDKIVARASRECGNKAVKKLLEEIDDEIN